MSRIRMIIILFLIALALPITSFAQNSAQVDPDKIEPDDIIEEFYLPPYTCMFCKTYLETLAHDTKHIFIFPTYWDRRDWLKFGLVSAGIAGLFYLDEPIQKEIQPRRNNVTDAAADIVNPFGMEAAYAIMAGFYLQGIFADNNKSQVVALDAISATLISWGMVAPLIKKVSGRSRPFQKNGPHHFEFFEFDAFPSGHTTQAFTLAAVINEHYHSKWLLIPSYGLASLVGLARMNKDKHWTSDVVAGALLGYITGNEIVKYNRRKRAELAGKELNNNGRSSPQFFLVPSISQRTIGFNLIIQP